MSSVFIYALLWFSFGVGHSLLTIAPVKRRLEPFLGSAYRVIYNLFAFLHFCIVYFAGLSLLSGNRFSFLSSWPFGWFSFFLMLAGVVLMLLALRQYDLGQFSGLTQLRRAKSADKQASVDVLIEPLNRTGLNKFVRHPLYSGVFLFVWGNAVSPFGFWTAVFASLYLLVGAHYEERKLIRVYGNEYQNYKELVPAFVPKLN